MKENLPVPAIKERLKGFDPRLFSLSVNLMGKGDDRTVFPFRHVKGEGPAPEIVHIPVTDRP